MSEQSPLILSLLSTPLCPSLGVARAEMDLKQLLNFIDDLGHYMRSDDYWFKKCIQYSALLVCNKYTPTSSSVDLSMLFTCYSSSILGKQIWHAVSIGDSEKLHKLLHSTNRPPTECNVDMPLICLAAGKGFADIVGLLIRHGVSINAESSEGSTALIFAADGGHLPVLSVLLNAGALMNVTNRHGETALTRATRRGLVQCARILLSYGANPNPMPSDGRTFVVSPLHLARQMHQAAIEQSILSRSVSIDNILMEIVTSTLPNHVTLIEPGHLTDTKTLSFFPVQLISQSELNHFVLYFKTPPGHNSRKQTQQITKSVESTRNKPPSDELIFIYVIRVQVFENTVSHCITGSEFSPLTVTFNGTRKNCTEIPMPAEYPGIYVCSVASTIRNGGLNSLCLQSHPRSSKNDHSKMSTNNITNQCGNSMVLIGAYRVRVDVNSLIQTSMNAPKGSSKPSSL